MIAERSMEAMRQHHLETPEGRLAFLTDELIVYGETAEKLNREVIMLSEEIQTLSPQEDQQQIVSLTEEMAGKMGTLLKMLPVLSTAITIEEDFQELDVILQQTNPLSSEQQQVLDRIASLCDAIDNI